MANSRIFILDNSFKVTNKEERVLSIFFLYFFGPRGRSPSLPRDFTVYEYTVTLPVLRVFHCERCRI